MKLTGGINVTALGEPIPGLPHPGPGYRIELVGKHWDFCQPQFAPRMFEAFVKLSAYYQYEKRGDE